MRPKMGLPASATVGMLLLASTAQAWTFVWRDAKNQSHIETGDDATECAQINMPKGKVYSYDPESDEAYCINMFANSDCEGSPNGRSCPRWGPRPLGQDRIRGWYIERPGESSSSSSSSTAESSSTMSTATSSTASTASSTPTDEPPASEESPDPEGGSGGGSALSGGAIAGVVIGTLAGVAIIAVLIFILVRRHYTQKTKAPAAEASEPPKYNNQPPPPPPKGQELDSNVASPASVHQQPETPVLGAGQTSPASDRKEPPPGYGVSNRQHVSELPDNSVPQEMEAR